MAKKLKIVHVASEVSPYSRTGGLADGAGALPKALHDVGHDVIVVTPLYGQVIDIKKHKLEPIFENIEVKVDDKKILKVSFWRGYLKKDLPIYFVENKKYFSKRKTLYGSSHENARFLLFDNAVLKLLSLLKFKADIIQCHDWQTAIIPQLLRKKYRKSPLLAKTATLFTIHNLAFQMGMNWWDVPASKKDNGTKKIPDFDDPELEYINFAKRGILNADAVSTVSESYAEEIMQPRFGQDLNRILANRKERVFGIVNGIDHKEYNPETDPGLYRNFGINSIQRKGLNKIHIQNFYGLPESKKTPLVVMASRIAEQKGFDILLQILPTLTAMDCQFLIMGDGDKKYINAINKFNKNHPKKIKWVPFNRIKETSLYAAADMALLPSRFEPCGLVQIIASRYGAVPIVRDIGGLSDTVTDYNPRTGRGTGFKFRRYQPQPLLVAIARAFSEFEHKESWQELVRRIMQRSSSWEIQARKYIELYRKTMKIKTKNGKK
jgi:starch synthase